MSLKCPAIRYVSVQLDIRVMVASCECIGQLIIGNVSGRRPIVADTIQTRLSDCRLPIDRPLSVPGSIKIWSVVWLALRL